MENGNVMDYDYHDGQNAQHNDDIVEEDVSDIFEVLKERNDYGKLKVMSYGKMITNIMWIYEEDQGPSELYVKRKKMRRRVDRASEEFVHNRKRQWFDGMQDDLDDYMRSVLSRHYATRPACMKFSYGETYLRSFDSPYMRIMDTTPGNISLQASSISRIGMQWYGYNGDILRPGRGYIIDSMSLSLEKIYALRYGCRQMNAEYYASKINKGADCWCDRIYEGSEIGAIFVPLDRAYTVNCCTYYLNVWLTYIGTLILFYHGSMSDFSYVPSRYCALHGMCYYIFPGKLFNYSRYNTLRRIKELDAGGDAERYHRPLNDNKIYSFLRNELRYLDDDREIFSYGHEFRKCSTDYDWEYPGYVINKKSVLQINDGTRYLPDYDYGGKLIYMRSCCLQFNCRIKGCENAGVVWLYKYESDPKHINSIWFCVTHMYMWDDGVLTDKELSSNVRGRGEVHVSANTTSIMELPMSDSYSNSEVIIPGGFYRGDKSFRKRLDKNNVFHLTLLPSHCFHKSAFVRPFILRLKYDSLKLIAEGRLPRGVVKLNHDQMKSQLTFLPHFSQRCSNLIYDIVHDSQRAGMAYSLYIDEWFSGLRLLKQEDMGTLFVWRFFISMHDEIEAWKCRLTEVNQ